MPLPLYRVAKSSKVLTNTSSSSNFGSTTSTETILLAVQGPSTPLPMATDFRPYSSWKERAMP